MPCASGKIDAFYCIKDQNSRIFCWYPSSQLGKCYCTLFKAGHISQRESTRQIACELINLIQVHPSSSSKNVNFVIFHSVPLQSFLKYADTLDVLIVHMEYLDGTLPILLNSLGNSGQRVKLSENRIAWCLRWSCSWLSPHLWVHTNRVVCNQLCRLCFAHQF